MNQPLLFAARAGSILGCLCIAYWALAAARARPDVIPIWMARKFGILMACDAAINLSGLLILLEQVRAPQMTWLFVVRCLVYLLFAARLFTVRRDLLHVISTDRAREILRANEQNRAMLDAVEARLTRTWQDEARAAGWRPPEDPCPTA